MEVLKNWSFKKAGDEEWVSVAHQEGESEIFVDLLARGTIPDPFVDDNEKDVQWVGEQDWDYKVEFSGNELKCQVLKINGLDTFASVVLNGVSIWSNDNMFEIVEIDISKLIKSENELVIHFQSALLKAREIGEENKGYIPKVLNGEGNRVYIRKTQYHYGWDWGPLLMSCGPYRPLELFSFDDIRIRDTYIYPVFGDSSDSVEVFLELKCQVIESKDVKVEILDQDDSLVIEDVLQIDSEQVNSKYQISSPKLWYPLNYGDQPLYTLTIKSESGETLVSKKFGLRKISLVQDPLSDEPGNTFHFTINDVPIYISGVNWIPGHSFQTKMDYQTYYDWLSMTLAANFNMIRIWGGGVYEQDAFYEICDQLGILVWHDFMFACGQYPGDSAFIDSVTREVTCQLTRLRNFCSILLWSGNNEDYVVKEEYHLENNSALDEHSFPAFKIYEQVLPDLCSTLLKDKVPYHIGSPFGGSETCNDVTVGDIHQWNVWHGTQEPYQNWSQLEGRFVSEFGMLAFAHPETLKLYITDPKQWYPQSEMVCFHNKAAGSERRIGLYLSENFKILGGSLDEWCYLTQLMQSDCLLYLVRLWKRHWLDQKQGGYIIWQLNDCWPVNSWAIVDFHKRKKLLYYSLLRENASICIGTETVKYDEDGVNVWKKDLSDNEHQYKKYVNGLDLWVVNLSLQRLTSYKVKVQLIQIDTAELIDTFEIECDISPNTVSEIPNKIRYKCKNALVHYLLFTDEGERVFESCNWPQPVKFIKFNKNPHLNLEISGDKLSVSAKYPIKGLYLYSAREDVSFSDNCLDIIPNEKTIVNVENTTNLQDIKYRYYDM